MIHIWYKILETVHIEELKRKREDLLKTADEKQSDFQKFLCDNEKSLAEIKANTDAYTKMIHKQERTATQKIEDQTKMLDFKRKNKLRASN